MKGTRIGLDLERERRVVGDDGAFVTGEERHRQGLEDEHQPEGDEQRVLDACLEVEADHEAEEDEVEDDAHEEQRREDERHAQEGVQADDRDEEEGHVAAQHDELAVRHVEHLQHAEGERQAQRDEPVHGPAEEARDGALDD